MATTCQIDHPWNWKVRRHSPLAAGHNFAVLSSEAVSTCWPSGKHAARCKTSLWPSKVRRHSQLAARHSFAVMSSEAVSTCWPSGKHAARCKTSPWPSKVRRHSPLAARHSFAVLSSEAVSTCRRRQSPELHTSAAPAGEVVGLCSPSGEYTAGWKIMLWSFGSTSGWGVCFGGGDTGANQ